MQVPGQNICKQTVTWHCISSSCTHQLQATWAQNSGMYQTLFNLAMTTFPLLLLNSCLSVCADLHKNSSATARNFLPRSLSHSWTHQNNSQWNWYAFGSTTPPTWNRNRAVVRLAEWFPEGKKKNKLKTSLNHVTITWSWAQLTDNQQHCTCWLTDSEVLRVASTEPIQFKAKKTRQVFRSVRIRRDPLLAKTKTTTNRHSKEDVCYEWPWRNWLLAIGWVIAIVYFLSLRCPFSAIVPSPWPTPKHQNRREISESLWISHKVVAKQWLHWWWMKRPAGNSFSFHVYIVRANAATRCVVTPRLPSLKIWLMFCI